MRVCVRAHSRSSHNNVSTRSDSQIFSKAVQECLHLAFIQGHKSIAFPAIGTGCLNFTNDEVARIMTEAVEVSAKTMPEKMDVYFVIYPPERDTFMVTIVML